MSRRLTIICLLIGCSLFLLGGSPGKKAMKSKHKRTITAYHLHDKLYVVRASPPDTMEFYCSFSPSPPDTMGWPPDSITFTSQ